MGLYHCTFLYLQSKEIVRPGNLIDRTSSESWKQIIHNFKGPTSITDPNNTGQKIAHEYFQFPAQSLMCLKAADVAV